MRNKNKSRQDEAAAGLEPTTEERQILFDNFRSHLAMTIISDSVEYHSKCRFADCRKAGRCMSFDRFEGVCPVPLDSSLAMMFGAMIWFDNAKSAAQHRERLAELEELVAVLEAEIAERAKG
ncbi:hypothetical protein ABMA32_09175 [Mesorhizobium sp. VNQ89]|uniref:hypothetical protein n=1 Tax=Mesorhizobium quangtriensis TaxID=3157709 RepID=UPI0032B802F0